MKTVLWRLRLILFSWPHPQPLPGWPSGMDGQVALDAYNQLHFARKQCGSGSFKNAPSHGFSHFCYLWVALSEYASDEAALKTFGLPVTRCCVCFAGDNVMLSTRICYQISRGRRGWSWPTSHKWFWINWEILFSCLSLSEMFMCAMNILAGMYHFRICQDQMQQDYFFQSFLEVSICGLRKRTDEAEVWEITSLHF